MSETWKNETYKAMCEVFEKCLQSYKSTSVSMTYFYHYILDTLGDCPLSKKRVMLYLNRWFSEKEGWVRFGRHSWVKITR